jgi:hypothetical protein
MFSNFYVLRQEAGTKDSKLKDSNIPPTYHLLLVPMRMKFWFNIVVINPKSAYGLCGLLATNRQTEVEERKKDFVL